jgi:hypothetical protein
MPSATAGTKPSIAFEWAVYNADRPTAPLPNVYCVE